MTAKKVFSLTKMKVLAVLLGLGVGLSSGLGTTTCECGWRNFGMKETEQNMIVGGIETGFHEWPSVAALILFHGNKRVGHFCGSTIITRRHVITAAHCLKISNFTIKPDEVRVLVGAHDWTKSNPSNFLEVEKITVHENYQDRTVVDDIALIEVKEYIPFSKKVGPACFPKKRLNLDNEMVTAIGWGATWMTVDANLRSTVTPTNVPHKVFLTAYNDESCKRKYPFLVYKEMDVNQFCTFNPGYSACAGDSGGPIFWRDPHINRYFLAGVASYILVHKGKPACQDLTVFTDPAAYGDWIGARIGSESVCTKV